MDGVPPVRLAIRHGRDIEWRDATDWPLPETEWRELFLSAAGGRDWTAPDAGTATYPASFETAPADEPFELTGPVALRLWVSARTDDLDVFARLQHVGADGEVIAATGPQGAPIAMALGWL